MTAPLSPSAIVDFPDDDGVSARRLCFVAPTRVWRVEAIADVMRTLNEVDRAARAGGWIVGFVSYEAASAFDRAFGGAAGRALPLAWFAEFAAPLPTADDADVAHVRDEPGEPSTLAHAGEMSDAQYAESVRRIQAYIAAGDVYQVNLTVPFTADTNAPPHTLYERMRRAQGGSYACLLDIGDAQILSASPELFFRREGDRIHSRPMKGTAPRGLHPAADVAARVALLRSEKEHAENVMIVDVVRNDLGRIARLGSVSVASLCRPERYPSIWQLTSTVEARIDRHTSLGEVFRALFPPASVTGVPKIRATSIIRELEVAPREVYCGALGIVRPGGDATFNVAIRTAWTSTQSGVLHLNAGGGITADSTAAAELGEVRAKLAAFTRPVMTPALFETIRIERGVAVRLDRHLERLAASADYFAIPFDARAARLALDDALHGADEVDLARARLQLAASGALSAHWRRHDAHGSPDAMPVSFSSSPIDRADVRLYHKCVDRSRYESALAAAPGMFDVVLWNVDGEATELTRGNLVVELDGRCVTPPIDCGLLGGTLRAEMLERGDITECVVTLDDVRRADRLWFVNSLRGKMRIALQPSEPAATRTPTRYSASSTSDPAAPSSSRPSEEPMASSARRMSSSS